MTAQAHKHLLSKSRSHYQDIHKLIKTNGVIYLERRNDVSIFDFLARVVSGQQLSKSAAKTIYGRLEAFAADAELPLIEFVSEKNRERLLQCGLSRNKVKALLALKDAFNQRILVESASYAPTHEEISQKVTSIWGFGQWSADMTAIFYYGISDVWSDNDVSLQKGINILTGSIAEDSIKLVTRFSPYKSFLALHIWKGIDDGVLR